MLLSKAYYSIKFLVPRSLQIRLRRYHARRIAASMKNSWPIDASAARTPEGWKGWPGGKKFALVLTHDVETEKGLAKCLELAALEERFGMRSSFNFVAGDYQVPPDLRKNLSDRGFEIGIHGLHHHNNPFRSESLFRKQSVAINRLLKDWGAVGFRSPSMYHDLDMLHHLDIEYDASTFDTDPFEPQPDGMGTIFPFWVPGKNGQEGYVELPYTLPQDFLLFILLEEQTIDTWKRKLDWIAAQGGMALFITHPEYMSFNETLNHEQYPVHYYEEFLTYIQSNYTGQYWNALPRDMARFWKSEYRTWRQERRKIRTCMVSYSFYETDARVKRYAETLARNGDHVEVISLMNGHQKPCDTLNGVHVYRIQRRNRDEKKKRDYLARLLLFLIKSSFQLTKNSIKGRYDIIHVHSVPDFEVFAALVPKLLGARVILDIHDPVPDLFSAKFGVGKNSLFIQLLTLTERLSAGYADHVITVTDYWRDRIAERSKTPEEKISVILNLPDLRIFNRENCNHSFRHNSGFTLVYPGTLNRHCGLDTAIRAVSMVRDEVPRITFKIYGRGSEREKLQHLVEELDLKDVVLFHDYVPLESIPAIMCDSDIGIALLSGTDTYSQQALNVKLFEFLSMGLPAIASRTKSIEYYLNGNTVMLSEPNDPADVARCIGELYRNENRRAKLAQRGLAFIDKNNSESEMKKYETIIRKLLR